MLYKDYLQTTKTQDIAKGVYKRMQGRKKGSAPPKQALSGNLRSRTPAPNRTYRRTSKGGSPQTVTTPYASGKAISRRERKTAHTAAFHKQMTAGKGPTLSHVLQNLRKERKTAGEEGSGNLDRLKSERNRLLLRRSRLLRKMVPGGGKHQGFGQRPSVAQGKAVSKKRKPIKRAPTRAVQY